MADPDHPVPTEIQAEHVIVSCGAVQTARLLRMSGPRGGLGNSRDQLGRYATFHLFGLGAKVVLKPDFRDMLHGNLGHTGNTTSFAPYFVQDPVSKKWLKAGTLTSTAKKNPLENASDAVDRLGDQDLTKRTLLKKMEDYARTFELRLTADDLLMARNRVDLDPRFVDEYGFPVARITRELGPHEWMMYTLMEPEIARVFEPLKKGGVIDPPGISPPILDLIGDHQMGTCRMGADPATSVVDPHCRLHEAGNLFVVDSSFMPTGLGLNPMVTVVANALRVGTWIVDQLRKGAKF